MTAAPGPVRLGDRAFTGLLYNGAYVPPTLRARLGDTLADHVPQQSGRSVRARLPGHLRPYLQRFDTPYRTCTFTA